MDLIFYDGSINTSKDYLIMHFPYFQTMLNGNWNVANNQVFLTDFSVRDFVSIKNNIKNFSFIDCSAYSLMDYLMFKGYKYDYKVIKVPEKKEGIENLFIHDTKRATMTIGDANLPIVINQEELILYDGNSSLALDIFQGLIGSKSKFRYSSFNKVPACSCLYGELKIKIKNEIGKYFPQIKTTIKCEYCYTEETFFIEVNITRI